MISLKEIKSYIEKSENPLIFFDDDSDGLCSYLLIKKYFDKGKGILVTHSILDESYLKKVQEYNPDLILLLDKHGISQDLIDKVNVPIIWVDHHPIEKVEYKTQQPDDSVTTRTETYKNVQLNQDFELDEYIIPTP